MEPRKSERRGRLAAVQRKASLSFKAKGKVEALGWGLLGASCSGARLPGGGPPSRDRQTSCRCSVIACSTGVLELVALNPKTPLMAGLWGGPNEEAAPLREGEAAAAAALVVAAAAAAAGASAASAAAETAAPARAAARAAANIKEQQQWQPAATASSSKQQQQAAAAGAAAAANWLSPLTMEGSKDSAAPPEASKPEPQKLEFGSVSALNAWIAEQRSRDNFYFVLVRTHKAKPPRRGVSKALERQLALNPNAVSRTATFRCRHWRNPKDFVSYKKFAQRALTVFSGAREAHAALVQLRASEAPPKPSSVAEGLSEGAPPASPLGAPPETCAPPSYLGRRCSGNEGEEEVPRAVGQTVEEGAPSEQDAGGPPKAVASPQPREERARGPLSRALPDIEEEVLVLQAQLQQLRRRLRYRRHELPPKHTKLEDVCVAVTGALEKEAAALQARLTKLCAERDACVRGPLNYAAFDGELLDRRVQQQEENTASETERGGETSGSEGALVLATDTESLEESSEGEKGGEEKKGFKGLGKTPKNPNPQEALAARVAREKNERAVRAARRAAARGDDNGPSLFPWDSPAAPAAAAAAGGPRDMHSHCRRRLERMQQMRVVPHCSCPAELKIRYLVSGAVVVVLTNLNHSDACLRNRQAPYKTPKEIMAYIQRHSYLPLQTLRLCFEAPEVAFQLVREAPPPSPYKLSDAVIAYCLSKAHKRQGSSSKKQRQSAAAVVGWGCAPAEGATDLLPEEPVEETAGTEEPAHKQESDQPKAATAAETATAAAETAAAATAVTASAETAATAEAAEAAAANSKARGDEITAALQTLRCRAGAPSFSTPKASQGFPQRPPDEADGARATRRRGAPLEALSQRRRSPRLLELLLPAPTAAACSSSSCRNPSSSSSSSKRTDCEEARVPSKRHLEGDPHKRGRARRGRAPRGGQRGARGGGGLASRRASKGAPRRVPFRGALGGSLVRGGPGKASYGAFEADGAQGVPDANDEGGPPSEGPPSKVDDGARPRGPPADAAWAALAAYFWRQARRLEEEEGPAPHQLSGEARDPIPEDKLQGQDGCSSSKEQQQGAAARVRPSQNSACLEAQHMHSAVELNAARFTYTAAPNKASTEGPSQEPWQQQLASRLGGYRVIAAIRAMVAFLAQPWLSSRAREGLVGGPGCLRGRVALITGGGSGIGKGIAKVFLSHGAKVAIMSRNLNELQQSTGGGECMAVRADVRSPSEVEAAVEEVLAVFSRLDILVNCAAGNFLVSLEQLTLKGFRTVFDIDAQGVLLVSKVVFHKAFQGALKKHILQQQQQREEVGVDEAAAAAVRASGECCKVIINISMTLHYSATLLQTHAGVAKAAVDALTKHMAVEWGPYGVRVNGVAPGPIAGTEGIQRLSAKPETPPRTNSNRSTSSSGSGSGKEVPQPASTGGGGFETLTKYVPLQRLGTVQDIAFACLFLSLPEARCVCVALHSLGPLLKTHTLRKPKGSKEKGKHAKSSKTQRQRRGHQAAAANGAGRVWDVLRCMGTSLGHGGDIGGRWRAVDDFGELHVSRTYHQRKVEERALRCQSLNNNLLLAKALTSYSGSTSSNSNSSSSSRNSSNSKSSNSKSSSINGNTSRSRNSSNSKSSHSSSSISSSISNNSSNNNSSSSSIRSWCVHWGGLAIDSGPHGSSTDVGLSHPNHSVTSSLKCCFYL
ncbi:hypothetical protein Esti_004541 [Eimeria stiedai]